MKEYLVISTNADLVRTAAEDVLYITSDGNYSSLVFTYGESRMVAIQLGQIEGLIRKQLVHSGTHFVRIGKSLIINREYISYINLSKQQLVLSNGSAAMHTLSASKVALNQLKELIERELQ